MFNIEFRNLELDDLNTERYYAFYYALNNSIVSSSNGYITVMTLINLTNL